jgi:tetratricopeptide (TPR) repeat protein
MNRNVCFLAVICCTPAVCAAQTRTWFDNTRQHSVTADLEELRTNEVILKRADETLIAVPLERLSNADREYLKLLSDPADLRSSNRGTRHCGLLWLRLDFPRRAIPDCDRAILLDKTKLNAHVYRGLANSRLGNFTAAVRDLTRAIELGDSRANTDKSCSCWTICDTSVVLRSREEQVGNDPPMRIISFSVRNLQLVRSWLAVGGAAM